MTTTDWRVVIIVLGVLAFLVVGLAARVTHTSKAEAFGMAGGALVCLAVAAGAFGFLMDWDGTLWLPFVAFSLAYCTAGRVIQLINIWRKKRP